MNALERWRKAKGLNYQQLADLIRSSHETACRYCRGRRTPTPDNMRRIYLATNGAVQPNDFYDLPPLATVDPGVQELDGAGDRLLDGGGQEGPVDEQAAQDFGALGVGASAGDGDRGLGGHGAKSATAGDGGQAA